MWSCGEARQRRGGATPRERRGSPAGMLREVGMLREAGGPAQLLAVQVSGFFFYFCCKILYNFFSSEFFWFSMQFFLLEPFFCSECKNFLFKLFCFECKNFLVNF